MSRISCVSRGGVGVDGAIGRRHDGHVRGDEAVVGVQGRDHGLLLAIRPQRQIRHRSRRNDRRVEDIGLALLGGAHALPTTLTVFSPMNGLPLLLRVSSTRHGATGYSDRPLCSGRGEVAVDVDDEIGRVVGVDVDVAVRSRRERSQRWRRPSQSDCSASRRWVAFDRSATR